MSETAIAPETAPPTEAENAAMRELIEYVTKQLVEKPDEIKLREIKGAKSTVFELSCAPGDMGRIIGKDGRIVKSLRTLLKAVAAKHEGYSVELEVLD